MQSMGFRLLCELLPGGSVLACNTVAGPRRGFEAEHWHEAVRNQNLSWAVVAKPAQ